MTRLIGRLRPSRMLGLMALDFAAWVGSFAILAGLQAVIADSTRPALQAAVIDGAICGLVFIVLGVLVRLHQGRAALGSFEDAMLVGVVAAITGAANLVAVLLMGIKGHGVLLVAGPLAALIAMIWTRGLYRMMRDRHFDRPGADGLTPVLIVGAGDAGRQLIQSMRLDPNSTWRPVGLVDDDPAKRHRRIRGVTNLGTTADLADIADCTGARAAILAMPSAGADVVRRISGIAAKAGLEVKVLPPISEMLSTGRIDITDIRDIDVADLLGRHVIDTDVRSIAHYLAGKRVLVTGAGGSIGSELCRQIAPFHPAELIMLDRDESALHAVQLSLTGRALLDGDDMVLGDIRDVDFVSRLFAERKPEVVFHAAALKHLPLLEKAPAEAVKTNVWGTANVLEAATQHGVERFVNISTDKAANPVSVLGYSKRLAEGLTAAYAAETEGTFLSVRFGNVLGSRGSVLTAFAKQIAAGGPVTVTDREVTRYFMTIAEACQLVIQAGAVGRDGEALVLDMGEPVSIDSVARQLIELSGKRIGIDYTGLRPGEKMHEELFADGEEDERPAHPLISHTWVPEYELSEARELDVRAPGDQIVRQLGDACLLMHGRLAVSRL